MALKKYADWRSLPAEMLRLLVRLTRDQRRLLAAAMDGVLCVLAVWIAYSLRLGTWDLFFTTSHHLCRRGAHFMVSDRLVDGSLSLADPFFRVLARSLDLQPPVRR